MNEFEVLPLLFLTHPRNPLAAYDMDVIRCLKIEWYKVMTLALDKELSCSISFLSWRNSTKKHLGGFPM